MPGREREKKESAWRNVYLISLALHEWRKFKEFSFDLVWIYHRFRVCPPPHFAGGSAGWGSATSGLLFHTFTLS
jgi:hypothetical protein